MNIGARAWVSIALLLATAAIHAHERSESYSHWYLSESGVTGTVTIPLREVMLLYQNGDSSIPPRELFRNHLIESTSVFADDSECADKDASVLQAASGFVRIELHVDCAARTPTAISYRALFDVAPGHVHYAKLHRDNVIVADVLITDTNDFWNIGIVGDAGGSYSFTSFLVVGIDHISSGVDHIAFLLGLLLIAGTLGRSVIAVTGFTLGHSISLAAAVLGYVSADSRLVEAFIGFTVALVAVEYFLARRNRAIGIACASLALAWAAGVTATVFDLVSTRALFAYLGFGVFAACYLLASRNLAQTDNARATILLFTATTCFGLVHGFGFAGFLMDTGILGSSLFIPLLGFNLGVEIGQLILVLVALALASLVGRHVPRVTSQLLAAGLCGLGVFWFVGRTLA